ncbi:MAG: DUF2141 domain-containing protein [Cyanobacteria bacterium P01_D01_bin.56]
MNSWALGATLLVSSVAMPVQGQTEPSQLTVAINGLNEAQGQICLSLFDRSAGFPSDRNEALQATCIPATEETSATFADLSPGSYAVSVYHDANSDNEFNRNFVGMPTEGYGFSQNPSALTGPPDFGEAVFLVAGPENYIEIELTYF